MRRYMLGPIVIIGMLALALAASWLIPSSAQSPAHDYNRSIAWLLYSMSAG